MLVDFWAMILCVSCDEGSVCEDELPLCQGLGAHNVPPHVRRLCDPAQKGWNENVRENHLTEEKLVTSTAQYQCGHLRIVRYGAGGPQLDTQWPGGNWFVF